jgi:SPP1 gp7 family putative phage head morphogenesis protein
MSEWLNHSLTFDEAVAWAKQRNVVLPDEYYGSLAGIARAQAFSVAGLASIDQIEAVKAALDNYLMQGKPFGNFVNDVKDGIIPIDLPKSRLDNIFRTNIQGAYNAGRYAAQQDFKESRPYLMYDAINDSRTRPSHRAMDNIIKPMDDPFWETHYPPNGYRCRCHVRSLSIEQAEKKGGTTLNVPANAKPDEGWDYNGGKDRLSGVKQAVKQKLEQVNPSDVAAYSLLVQMDKKLDDPTE